MAGDLARELLRVTALNDDGGYYEKYLETYRNSDDLGQRINILLSIYFKNPDIIKRRWTSLFPTKC